MSVEPVNEQSIALAAELLGRGKLVAFPTETVYGLGADAGNDLAVASIFEAKGRPQFNPLIAHIADVSWVEKFAVMTPCAKLLAERFWPGPLTLVMKRTAECPISHLVSAGLDTVGVRFPVHPDARKMLKAFGKPVAAPSANISGTVSPTTAQHVAQGLHRALFQLSGRKRPCRRCSRWAPQRAFRRLPTSFAPPDERESARRPYPVPR